MKNFKFVHETPEHFVLHNGRAHFHVAKNGIDEPTADRIRALSDGGEVDKKDTDLENPPKADLDQDYKATELPEPEKEPKRREIESEMPEPEAMAEGGKLTAKARAEIPQKNFALPNGRYPIEDANHARNALARVSQHGSSEEKATVRSKVHSKYPGIEQKMDDGGQVADPAKLQSAQDSMRKAFGYDDGGQVQSPPIDPDKAQSAQDSMRKAFGYSDGGKAGAPQQISTPDPTPTPTIAPPAANPDVTAALRGAFGQRQPASENKAGGGPVASNAVQDISHETQSEAIGRYAAGNPANMSKGGSAQHYSQGKYHFHFYDGGPVTHSDKQPDAPPTPLDNYTNMADGGPTMQLSAADVDPNAVINPGYNKPTELQQEIDQATQDQAAPSPEQSANNLAGTMGQQTPFQQDDQSSSASSPAPTAGKAIAPQNQISMVPKSLPPNPGQNVDLMTEFNKNLQGEQQALQEGGTNQAKAFAQQNEILKNHLVDEELSHQKYQQDQQENTNQANYLFQKVADSKVDPNKYWNDKSTGGKISAAIGLILGGASSGLTGRSNPALDVMQNAIKNDISAQRDNQSNAMNLYKMGLQKYKDRAAAEDYAQMHMNSITQGMLQRAANTSGGAMAQTNAKLAINKLGLDNVQLRTNLGMQQAALNSMGQPSSTSGVNPDKMRLLTMSGIIPKEEVPIADKENADYQKLSDTLDHTDDIFNQARQNATYTERALPGWTPTLRDASKKYEAVTNAWLGNITKETEGRVTPTDVDLMRSSLPKAGDPPDVYQTKLNSVKDMVRQKFAFPTLQKYRVLSPNDPVSTPGATRKKRFNETPK